VQPASSAVLVYVLQIKSIDTELSEQYTADMKELRKKTIENEVHLMLVKEKASKMTTKMDTVMGEINQMENMLAMTGVAAVAAAGLVSMVFARQVQQKEE
jgi:DNA primase catalytic subunit